MRTSRSSRAAVTAGDVFTLIRSGDGTTTRTRIGHATDLSRTAVAARVAALQDAGLVLERAEAASSPGRPAAGLTVNPGAGVVLAAAIGRSRTQLGVCNLAGDLLAMCSVDQEIGVGPDELMPTVVQTLDALLEECGHRRDEVRGVGMSIPGTADPERVCTLDSPAISGWDGVPLTPFLRTVTNAPVLLDNDANVIVLAERRGQRDRFEDMLLIKASTGLGAGIVAGGALQRGKRGAAGEFGHTKVEAAAGISCRCGDTGCLEAVASGWALVRELRDHGRHVAHLRDVVELALSGDAEARRLIRDSGRHVGEVLAGAVNLLNPEALVVAGDMAGAYDLFVAGLRESVYGNATALATRELRILPSTHGEKSSVVGSATLILDHVLSAEAIDAAL
ncbi:ROK family protein [Tsukamurella paurometabola]|nr:ROK family protein [Tsukamurella paurometabola]